MAAAAAAAAADVDARHNNVVITLIRTIILKTEDDINDIDNDIIK